MARSRNVYTSSAILTVWYHFARHTAEFMVTLTLPEITNRTEVYTLTVRSISTDPTKVQSIKFHASPSCSSSADTRGRTDMTQQVGAFCDHARAPTDCRERNYLWKEPILTEYQAATIPALDRIFKPITSWTQATNATSSQQLPCT